MSYESLLRSELVDVYKQLQLEEEEQQCAIEELHQSLYHHQQETTRLLNVQQEIVAEIAECHNDDNDDDIETLQSQKLMLEERFALTNDNHAARMNDMRDMITQFKLTMSIIEKQMSIPAKAIDDHRFEAEDEELRQNVDVVLEGIANIQKYNEEMEVEKQAITAKIACCERDVEVLRQRYAMANEEMASCARMKEVLHADIATAKIRIESIKSQPLEDASRGNSMFAEVHDRRVQLERRLRQFQSSQIELQHELENLRKESRVIDKKNLEYVATHERAMQLMNNRIAKDKQCSAIIDELRQNVDENIDQLSKPFESSIFDSSVPEERYLQSLYEGKEADMVKTLKNNILASLERIRLTEELLGWNDERRNAEVSVLKLNLENDILKTDKERMIALKGIQSPCVCAKQHVNDCETENLRRNTYQGEPRLLKSIKHSAFSLNPSSSSRLASHSSMPLCENKSKINTLISGAAEKSKSSIESRKKLY